MQAALGDGAVDGFGIAQIDQRRIAGARRRDDPGDVMRRVPCSTWPLRIGVIDGELGDFDQHGLGREILADFVPALPRGDSRIAESVCCPSRRDNSDSRRASVAPAAAAPPPLDC